MNLIDLIIDTAATVRLTRLVVEDEVTRPAREAVESKLGADSRLTYLVNCPFCVSVWSGVAVQILPKWAVRALALSGLVIATRWASDVSEGIAR